MDKRQKICYWGSLCASVVLLVAFITCLVVHIHSDPVQERDQCRKQLKNETSALEGQVARAWAEGTVLQAALAKANQTLRETRRGWESCQALMDRLQNNLTALQAEFTQLEARGSNQMQAQQDLRDHISKLQGQLSSKDQQLQDTQSQLQDTQSQLQDTQSQLQDTQSQLQNTQSQLQDTQSQLQDTQQQRDRLQAQLKEQLQNQSTGSGGVLPELCRFISLLALLLITLLL
ncbi:uncharacterized protein LOC102371954 isoform X2 [Alligator sinensis]|uniref:Uncharacterized protein LOC102371954 isoform X1 n=1 Tax=Alligator sinensis TaxID=38654 RepID=A0A3Q0FXX3_ALLSI|nr:uncharacterized protein LOC102371954 isoform X1 [Alligator sinensis]XP_025052123.1 uncharacterized protein LOC102371954 isoform X2 [Alligator sinensis]